MLHELGIGYRPLLFLAVALATGLLIGVERGWSKRDEPEGSRVAGLRTHGLIALLGGALAQLSGQHGALLLGLAFLGLVAVSVTAYALNREDRDDAGITSLIAGLLSFVFGALAGSGQLLMAASGAVIATLLLSFKPTLHGWLRLLREGELKAGLKLLLISVVILPILPRETYGPGGLFNPFETWLLVVLIAAISFCGYFAMRFVGPRAGLGVTGSLAGLASSTGATLHFARLARREPEVSSPEAALGILLAGGTMLPRLLLIIALLSPGLLLPLAPTATLAVLPLYLAAAWNWRHSREQQVQDLSAIGNPLELRAALWFGLVLSAVLLMAGWLRLQLGDGGLLVVGALSGITGIDAMALTVSRTDAPAQLASQALLLALAVNNLAKLAFATAVGGRSLGTRLALPMGISAALALLAAWLLPQIPWLGQSG